MKRGCMLVNVGSPDAPTPAAVRAYLRRFLVDPRILGMPAWLRYPLVYGLIAPLRAPKSAAAYRRIWTPEGSPLVVHGEALAAAVGAVFATGYGRPTIDDALDRLGDVEELVVMPLFPQYAGATVGSVVDGVGAALSRRAKVPAIRVIPPFWSDAGFLDAVAEAARPTVQSMQPDRVLFSFHGLPLSHAQATCGLDIREDGACCVGQTTPPFCYRSQCVATANAVAARLGCSTPAEVSFQSRFGPARWIGPSTLATLARFAAEGVRSVVVVTPAFVADCLETIEEIGIGAREHFLASGGTALAVAPCVNQHPVWLDTVRRLVA